MRKFALYRTKNGVTDYIPLNGPHYYLVGPQGLGVDFNPDIASFDNSFFKTIKNTNFDERPIQGTLLIYDETEIRNAYHMYQIFLNWCIEADELYFGYDPLGEFTEEISPDPIATFEGTGLIWQPLYDNLIDIIDSGVYITEGEVVSANTITTYRADVELTNIAKSEINVYGALECPIVFKMLTPWYDNTQETFVEYTEYDESIISYEHTMAKPIGGHLDGAIDVKVFLESVADGFSIEFFDVPPEGSPVRFLRWGDSQTGHAYENLSFEYSSKYTDCKYHISGTQIIGGVSQAYDKDWIQEIDAAEDIFKRLPIGHKLKIAVTAGFANGAARIQARQYDYYLGV